MPSEPTNCHCNVHSENSPHPYMHTNPWISPWVFTRFKRTKHQKNGRDMLCDAVHYCNTATQSHQSPLQYGPDKFRPSHPRWHISQYLHEYSPISKHQKQVIDVRHSSRPLFQQPRPNPRIITAIWTPKIPSISCALTQILEYLHEYSLVSTEQNTRKAMLMGSMTTYQHVPPATQTHQLALQCTARKFPASRAHTHIHQYLHKSLPDFNERNIKRKSMRSATTYHLFSTATQTHPSPLQYESKFCPSLAQHTNPLISPWVLAGLY